jgi:transposase InsO family protein
MLRDRLGLSERRACRYVGQHRSTQRHGLKRAEDDAALRAELRTISQERPRWGYRRAHALLGEEGWEVTRKRVQRLWREEGLRVPQRTASAGGWASRPCPPPAWRRSGRITCGRWTSSTIRPLTVG